MSENNLTALGDPLQVESGFLNVSRPSTTSKVHSDPLESSLEYRLERYLAARYGLDGRAAGQPTGPQRPASEDRIGGPAGPSNTALDSSNEDNPRSFFDSSDGGYDWLEATIYGEFGERYRELVPELEKCKANAVDRTGERCVMVGPPVDRDKPDGDRLLCYQLVVASKGHRWGNTFMHWVVEYDGIKISLAKPGQSDDCPVAKIQIGSLALMRDGGRYAWEQSLKILDYLGIGYQRSSLSRVDLCVDLAGIDMIPFAVALLKGEVIKRIKSGFTPRFGEDGYCETIEIGRRGACMVSIYDKMRELAAERDQDIADAKLAELVTRRYGRIPDKAVRVEFKVWGTWMKEKWTCRSVEDLFGCTRALLDYLTQSFFRLVDGPVDRENKNQSRAVVSPLWQSIVGAFATWAGEKLDELETIKDAEEKSRRREDGSLKPVPEYKKAEMRRAAQERRVMRIFGPLIQVMSMCPEHFTNGLEDLEEIAVRLIRCYGDWPVIRRKIDELRERRLKNGSREYIDGFIPPTPIGFDPLVPF